MSTSASDSSMAPTAAPRAAGGELAGRKGLVLINSDEGGGVEHLASLLIADLQRMGADIRIVPLYLRGTRSARSKVAGILRAAAQVLTTRADIVMAFQPTSSVIAGMIGRVAGSKARIIHQSNMPGDTHPLPRWLDKAIGSLGFYSCNIANSAATEAAFSDYPDRYKRSLRRIDHGIDWRPAKRSRAEVLEALGVPDDGPIILSCARLVPQKRLHVIVEALALMPRVRFVVLGQGPERERLLALAARLGVAERLHLVGHFAHDQIHDIYAASDVFAFPSEWETFGLAAVEAAMHGVPVVANDLPTLREVLRVDDGCIATLISAGQAADWAAEISTVSANAEARARAQAFAPLLRQRYGIERMLSAYQSLYRELLR